jgi:hypothetical protein
MKHICVLGLVLFGFLTTAPAAPADRADAALASTYGPHYGQSGLPARPKLKKGTDALHRWNQIAVDTSGYDHGTAREQLGPGRASRAMAIVHIAMFDAMNAVVGEFESYTDVERPKGSISLDAAIAQAAHNTLVALFPSQSVHLDSLLNEDLSSIKDAKQKARGILLGTRAAGVMMAFREGDGSELQEPMVGTDHPTSPMPGRWRQDPISLIPLALGAYWSKCAPFVVESSQQFRCPPFPAMTSPEYAAAYNEVKRVGGDGLHTPTERTPDQTVAAIYWAYDGTPSLCAPPRLYNQITVLIADQMGTTGLELARLLVLVNVAMSDATLTCWESKYYYDIWRPVTGIRESDAGTGPTGMGDGNDATIGDPLFYPLGAPASNLNGPNFTPPFPAYPSGHATMGGALFQTLRRYYGTDDISFTFVSDELNGVTKDNTGGVRPVVPRSFANLSQAEEENGQSRIYLGIHWSFDKTAGIAMGRQVADYVFDNAFLPIPHKRH